MHAKDCCTDKMYVSLPETVPSLSSNCRLDWVCWRADFTLACYGPRKCCPSYLSVGGFVRSRDDSSWFAHLELEVKDSFVHGLAVRAEMRMLVKESVRGWQGGGLS